MTRKYLINDKVVNEYEFREAAATNAGADIILRLPTNPSWTPPETKDVVSPERARELRKLTK